jgi:hypothetical protein
MTRHHLDSVHVNLIQVGALLAVNLDVDEILIHQPGYIFILKRLFLHYVTPVAGAVTYTQKKRLRFSPCSLKSLLAP